MTNHAAEAEKLYDHYDDMGQFDAATIREMSGYEADGTNEDFTADAIAARTGNVALTGYMADSEPVRNEKGGLNHNSWERAKADPVQAEIIQNGVNAARQAIEEARAQRER